jgi:hypothetical protein
MKDLFDRYAWGARVLPAFLTLMPLALAAIAWVPKVEDAVKPTLSLLVSAGAVVLLGHVARSLGTKAQKRLVAQWGAMPSVLALRHGDSMLGRTDKARYHAALARLMEIQLPTEAQEQADLAAADDVYRACTTFLISKTRDTKKFPLLFEENIAYGFRRNLLGLKVIGILLSAIGAVVCGAKIGRLALSGAPDVAAMIIPLVCLLVSLGMLWVWLWIVSDSFVRQQADAYSLRLFEALEHL